MQGILGNVSIFKSNPSRCLELNVADRLPQAKTQLPLRVAVGGFLPK
jgi:hypothetical protein